MLALNMFFLRAGPGFGPEPGWGNVDPVTIVKKKFNATGARWQIMYVVTGDSGNTLLCRLKFIESVIWDDPLITGVSVESGVLTITSTAAFTAAQVTVVGR